MEGRPLQDPELIELAREGDVRAYGELVERYRDLAFRTAYLITRSAAGAEDAAQDAFVKAFLVWLALPVPFAAAGGGCHTGVTYGDGIAVVMQDACFTPTILYVAPGTDVAFSNEDPLTHNVTANGWGHFDPMDQGDGSTATFDRPGVYPFACQYHPGMTGAVVVGDGKGDGSGEYVTVEPRPRAWVGSAAEPSASSSARASVRGSVS